MTPCLTALELEQLALKKLDHSNGEPHAHLESCSFCRSKFAEYIEFYSDVNSAYKERMANEQTPAIGSPSHRYLLFYLHRVEHHLISRGYRPTLAADSPALKQGQNIKNVGVYTSSDERLMVRILQEHDGGYSLFLLADEPALYQNVLVQIVGWEQEYISDAQGQIHLGNISLPDIESLGIEVRTATETYDLKTLFAPEQTFIGDETISLKSGTDKHIGLQILSDGRTYSLKIDLHEIRSLTGDPQLRVMVVTNKDSTEVKHPEKGIVVFKDIADPASVQVKIFE